MGQNYSPLGQDDDDEDVFDGPKVGKLFDLNTPASPAPNNQSSFQGAQGASVDPFGINSIP